MTFAETATIIALLLGKKKYWKFVSTKSVTLRCAKNTGKLKYIIFENYINKAGRSIGLLETVH